MQEISISDFRQKCLGLMDDLPPDGLLITRHGHPVARVLPVRKNSCADLIGTIPDLAQPGDDLFSTGEARTHFSRLLDQVLQGEAVLITRNNVPVAELAPARQPGLQLGAGRDDASVNHEAVASDSWWKPMTDEEAEAFLEGR